MNADTASNRPYKAFGAWLREQREQRNLSQEDLADAVGVAQGTVSVWELGASAPSIRNQRRLATALGSPGERIRSLLGDERPHLQAVGTVPLPRALDEHPASFLDPLIGSYGRLTDADRTIIVGIVRGYLESRQK